MTQREEMLVTLLKEAHRGKKHPVSSAKLESMLHTGGKDLRKMVNRLRQQGVPIASGQRGYFYADTAGDIYATIRMLQVMEKGLQNAIRGLEETLDGFGKAESGGGGHR